MILASQLIESGRIKVHIELGEVILRKPEPRDLGAIYSFKNDGATARQLGGFSSGYSLRDLEEWLEFHRKRASEVIWVIASKVSDACIGHVGLYDIDHRIGCAEFAIVLSDDAHRDRGLGQKITRAVLAFSFDFLNLGRIELSVLETNSRAIHVYEKVGFVLEGTRRRAQYKDGIFTNVHIMAILKDEFRR